jgi:hypothetical protein
LVEGLSAWSWTTFFRASTVALEGLPSACGEGEDARLEGGGEIVDVDEVAEAFGGGGLVGEDAEDGRAPSRARGSRDMDVVALGPDPDAETEGLQGAGLADDDAAPVGTCGPCGRLGPLRRYGKRQVSGGEFEPGAIHRVSYSACSMRADTGTIA